MNNDLVSVITPVYNAKKDIAKTIDSVLSQTYKNFEMILVDDYSTESSDEIIEEYMKKDERIKYIKLKKNSGAAVARNTAIDNAKGRFIAFIDSDDIWKREKLQNQIEFMKKNDIDFSFTSYRYVKNGKNEKIAHAVEKIDYNGLLKNTLIGCSTVIIDIKKLGKFHMPNVRRGQDFATRLMILKKIPYAYGIDEVYTYYKVGDDSLSHNKVKAFKRTWNIYRNIENFGILKSSYYFCFYAINAVLRRIK
ncbi:MAG: glycosyltransferase family 2 protein [Peptoniphilaceae bacterium]|nr:glycosyltransferase [Peptoniphilaceae bacterium]MDD7382769.1 glycosyltransferase family 2 protein [Peptoniphilaceae bacterium]MDY3737925.1 glycosyltransferase family 2 protein [Peptoniphilaceae bacterium]